MKVSTSVVGSHVARRVGIEAECAPPHDREALRYSVPDLVTPDPSWARVNGVNRRAIAF